MHMQVRKLTAKDIKQVSKMHQSYLDAGVISHLGQEFLIEFYKCLLKQKSTFTYVSISDGIVVGFVTGAINLKLIPKLLFKNLWYPFILSTLKNPKIVVQVIQMPFYPSFKQNKKIGEIFSLAVSSEYRKKGTGKSLIRTAEKKFKKMGYHNYQVSVRKKMISANKFYKKIGLKKVRTEKFLGEKICFWEGVC